MRRIKFYFHVLINWKSIQRIISQKYWRVKLYYLHSVFDICMITWQWIHCRLYYYVDQSSSSSIVQQLFKNQYFVRRILNSLSIVEVYLFLVIRETVDRLLLIMWSNFSRLDKKVVWLNDKKSNMICVQNRTYVRNTKEELSIWI